MRGVLSAVLVCGMILSCGGLAVGSALRDGQPGGAGPVAEGIAGDASGHRPGDGLPNGLPAVDEVLRAWERASFDVEPPGETEEKRLEYTYRESLSAHELSLVFTVHGPVQARELAERYDWTVIEAADGLVLLSGSPRDPVERLFFAEFRLALDAEQLLPVLIEFTGRPGKTAAAALALAPSPRWDLEDDPARNGLASTREPRTLKTPHYAVALRPAVGQALEIQRLRDVHDPQEVVRRWQRASMEALAAAGSPPAVQAARRSIVTAHGFGGAAAERDGLLARTGGETGHDVNAPGLDRALRVQGSLEALRCRQVDDLQRHYAWQLLRTTSRHVWLKGTVRRQDAAPDVREALVVLDRASWLPEAIRTRDSAGNVVRQEFLGARGGAGESGERTRMNESGPGN